MLNLVGIGGGTGLPQLLSGLKEVTAGAWPETPAVETRISAIVCVSDNGGSSGHLRQTLGIPAVGDLRNCLVALSEDRSVLPELFQYRFADGNGLQGHSLGNLFLTALCQTSGSLNQAVSTARAILQLKGFVFPVTEASVTLCAELECGEIVRGEVEITAARRPIRGLWMEPGDPPPAPGVLQTLTSADAIVLGPGSLYTSLLPHLLVAGVAEAIRKSPALKIFVCNLMTQPGETDGFTAADHLRVLENWLGAGSVDVCVLNTAPVSPAVQDEYLRSGAEPVRWDAAEIARMGILPAAADLLREDGLRVRHDPARLACSIVSLTREAQREQSLPRNLAKSVTVE